ncbi:hypothetical protein [Thermococcus sp.]|uniref:hypothetical protein n=1 Tax=Thermococcus sp. TaxID=35749 RepID=UPI0025E8F260|nr:hypothetical protein [Thermococcus sp.]
MEVKDPRAVKFVLLHPFIALILSHHSAAETSTIGKAVSDALNVFYGQMGKTYEDAKKEPDKLIDYIITMAKFNHVPIVEEKLREQLKQGLPKAFKIVDKLLPDNSKEHAMLLQDALDYDVKDPLVLLKQAGIDIEPELEEFREFLAEISGKKPTKGKAKTQHTPVSAELIAVAKALEYSGFSTGALKRAEEDLLKRLDALLEDPESNAIEIAYTAKLLRLIQRGEVDRIKEFSR